MPPARAARPKLKPKPKAGAAAPDRLSPGDLVLAKVRGYSAWPAKIGKPEEWDQVPLPNKYLVEFFGTYEIAFVAPVDIQLFTNESKSQLLSHSQRKSVRYFTRAVEEICGAFESLHQKNSALFDDKHNTAGGCVSLAVDLVDSKHQTDNGKTEVEQEILDWKESYKNEQSSNKLRVSEQCPQSSEGADLVAGSCGMDSSILSVQARNKESQNFQHIQKGVFAPQTSATSSTMENLSCSPVGKQYGLEMPLEAKITTTFSKGSVSSVGPTYEIESICSKKKNKEICGSVYKKREESGALEVPSPLNKSGVVQKEVKLGHRPLVPDHVREIVLALEAPKNGKPHEQGKNVGVADCVEVLQKRVLSRGEGNSTSHDFAGKLPEKTPEVEATRSRGKRLDILKEFKQHSFVNDISHEVSDMVEPDRCRVRDIEGSLHSKEFARKEFHFRSKVDSQEGLEESTQDKSLKCSNGSGHIHTKNCDSSYSAAEDEKFIKYKRSTCVKDENFLSSKSETDIKTIRSTNNEVLLPPRKRSCTELETMSSSAARNAEKGAVNTSHVKGDILDSDIKRSSLTHASSRHKLRRFDGDGTDGNRTPVHRGSFCSLIAEHLKESVFTDKSNLHSKNRKDSLSNVDNITNEHLSSKRKVKQDTDSISFSNNRNGSPSSSSRKLKKRLEKTPKMHTQRTRNEESSRFCSGLHAPSVMFPKASESGGDAAKVMEHKIFQSGMKVSLTSGVGKVPASSFKFSCQASESFNRSCDQVTTQDDKSLVTTKISKATLLSELHMTMVPKNTSDVNLSAEWKNKVTPLDERLVAAKEEKSSSLLVSTTCVASSKIKKNLIAAPLENKKEMNSRSSVNVILKPDINPPMKISENSCSLVSGAHPFSSGIFLGKDDAKQSSAPSFSSRSKFSEHSSLESEEYESRNNLGAAIACKTLEGMIDTLSRTKESIRHATRHAIKCARYGSVSEVIDLLVRKLEGEPSYHHRVDILFLLDSIVQCAHSQKGIMEDSFIPCVQAALPRLLHAAAPPGAGAFENRRQCLKILRLWMERKILPESLLHRYLDEIEVLNNRWAGSCVRRPSRTERSIEDPLREMEDMLIDEYGSNATFQFPGFSSSTILEDVKALSRNLCHKAGNGSPAEAVSILEEPLTSVADPSGRCSDISKVVDGGFQKGSMCALANDEKGIVWNDLIELESCRQNSSRISKPIQDSLTKHPFLPKDQSCRIEEDDQIRRYDIGDIKSNKVLKDAAKYGTSERFKTNASSKLVKFGCKDIYLTQPPHYNNQCQSGSTYRPYHSLPPLRRPRSHSFQTAHVPLGRLPYVKHIGRQCVRQAFGTYNLKSHSNGRWRYAMTEKMTMHSRGAGLRPSNRVAPFEQDDCF